jgi:DNA-binding XRE family transcriptional regulator
MGKISAKDRLSLILLELKTNKNKLSKELGYDNNVGLTNIEKGRYNFSTTLAKNIVDKFPQFNYDWLLTGNGEMILNENTEKEAKPVPSQLELTFEKLIEISSQNADTNKQNADSLQEIIALLKAEKKEKNELILAEQKEKAELLQILKNLSLQRPVAKKARAVK